MEEDETRQRPGLDRPALDRLGVAELERYIAELRAEIARAEAQISLKQGHRSEADGLFKFK